MPLLDVHGAQLAYDVYDDSESPNAVVFIHAGIATRFMWTPQVEHFRRDWRVVVYDTRSFGESFTEPVEFSNRADLLALLDHLGIRQVVLVGCSRGGQIALDFTLEHPDRVRALVSVCGGLGGFQFAVPAEEEAFEHEIEALYDRGDVDAAIERELKLWVIGLKRDDAQVDAALKDEYRRMMRDNYRHNERPQPQPIVLDPPAAERLGEVRVPMLIVSGAHDESYTRAAADAMAIGVAGAQRFDFPDSAHVPSSEHPVRFNQALADFLAGL